MPRLLQTTLDLARCPHCGVDMPYLQFRNTFELTDFQGSKKLWAVYSCNRCAGLIIARGSGWNAEIIEVYPDKIAELSDDIPERARNFLRQALDSIRSPSGAVMLAASSVDAMLKSKNLRPGTLFERINQAASQHLITKEMAQWAHDVRLDANDQRHADESAPLPTSEDAKRVIEFALALAQFMFVLPARVQRGLQSAQQGQIPLTS
jgi:hypothetical protein